MVFDVVAWGGGGGGGGDQRSGVGNFWELGPCGYVGYPWISMDMPRPPRGGAAVPAVVEGILTHASTPPLSL